MLDAAPAPRIIEGVKFPLPQIFLAAACLLPLALTACGPRSANPKQVTALHEQNTQLREEIARMEALIRQAGDEQPELAADIARREQEVKAAVEELCRLTNKETELKLRVIHLQGRLDAFQHSFNQMQKELSTTPQR